MPKFHQANQTAPNKSGPLVNAATLWATAGIGRAVIGICVAITLQANPLLASENKSSHPSWQCANEVSTQGTLKWRCKASEATDTNNQSSSAALSNVDDKTSLASPTQKPSSQIQSSASAEPNQHDDLSPVSAKNLALQDWQSRSRVESHSLAQKVITEQASQHCGGVYINPARQSGGQNQKILPDSISTSNSQDLPIEASADTSSMQNGTAVFTGNVLITQGSTSLRANTVSYDSENQQAELNGNVIVRSEQAAFGGESASINLTSGTANIADANYVVHQQHVHGQAERISDNGQGLVEVTDGSYTQCSPENTLWALKAKKIKLDQNSGQGSAKGAVIAIKDIPVVYVPYLRFPIGSQRQSGLLFPTLANTDGGFDLTLPYYLNITSNIDATIAPRYSVERGYITEAELRWLNRLDQWTVSGALLDKDDTFQDQQLALGQQNSNSKRWVIDVRERGNLSDNITTSIDFTRVSDSDFFRDLNTTSLNVRRTSFIEQRAQMQFLNDQWRAGARLQQYQILDSDGSNVRPFETLPEAWLAYRSIAKPFQLSIDSELRYSAFDHQQKTHGERSYGRFDVTYPMRWNGVEVTPKIGIQHLRYALESADNQVLGNRNPRFTAREASLKAKMSFEKWAANGAVRSLEPGLNYIYRHSAQRDRAEQNNLPNFDTAVFANDYRQLFRNTEFSGYDQLDDSNQIALHLNHRHINASGQQRLSATLGQILYFQNEREANLLNSATPIDQPSLTLGQAEIYLAPGWQTTGSAAWSNRGDQFEEGSVAVRYRAGDKTTTSANSSGIAIANLAFHYRAKQANNPLLIDDIQFADFSLMGQINRYWGLFGQFQYDITHDYSAESLAGVEYNNCCVKLRLVYREGLVYNDTVANNATLMNNAMIDNQPNIERDRSIVLQFELKGLFTVGNTVEKILSESILGYRSSQQSGLINNTGPADNSTQHTTF